MTQYWLTPAAKSDLKAIWTYTEDQWGAVQADRYMSELAAGIEMLAESPEMGRIREDIRSCYRSFRLGKHVVFYRAVATGIEVARILHQSMDIPRHLG